MTESVSIPGEAMEFMRDVLYAFADDEIEDGVEKDCPRCGKAMVAITVIGRRYWAEVKAEAPYMTGGEVVAGGGFVDAGGYEAFEDGHGWDSRFGISER